MGAVERFKPSSSLRKHQLHTSKGVKCTYANLLGTSPTEGHHWQRAYSFCVRPVAAASAPNPPSLMCSYRVHWFDLNVLEFTRLTNIMRACGPRVKSHQITKQKGCQSCSANAMKTIPFCHSSLPQWQPWRHIQNAAGKFSERHGWHQ